MPGGGVQRDYVFFVQAYSGMIKPDTYNYVSLREGKVFFFKRVVQLPFKRP